MPCVLPARSDNTTRPYPLNSSGGTATFPYPASHRHTHTHTHSIITSSHHHTIEMVKLTTIWNSSPFFHCSRIATVCAVLLWAVWTCLLGLPRERSRAVGSAAYARKKSVKIVWRSDKNIYNWFIRLSVPILTITSFREYCFWYMGCVGSAVAMGFSRMLLTSDTNSVEYAQVDRDTKHYTTDREQEIKGEEMQCVANTEFDIGAQHKLKKSSRLHKDDKNLKANWVLLLFEFCCRLTTHSIVLFFFVFFVYLVAIESYEVFVRLTYSSLLSPHLMLLRTIAVYLGNPFCSYIGEQTMLRAECDHVYMLPCMMPALCITTLVWLCFLIFLFFCIVAVIRDCWMPNVILHWNHS